jgi:UDP-N-acetylmuramoyl-tripeptide--D-alanyl-D-alanine ligase
MLELGPQSPQLHKETGRKCAEANLSWLIAVQGDARFFVEGAVAAGLPPAHTRFFPEARLAGEFCRARLEPGDVILVKGSRRVYLETVIEMLRRGVEKSRSGEVGGTRSQGVEASRGREVGEMRSQGVEEWRR